MKKNLWFSTALFIAMMGAAAPAPAQQYLERYKVTDKPSVEVDMGALATAPQTPAEPAQQQPPANTAPLPQVDQQELMRAASEDMPDKKLDKPFFTDMTPAPADASTQAPPVEAPKTAPSQPAPVVAAMPEHHMRVPPRPRHKPQTATMTATMASGNMPAVKPVPVDAAPLEKRPSLVTMPMLSLPSRMPPLAVDNAKMPPIGTAAPVVAPQPAYGLTQDESKSAAVPAERQEPPVAAKAAPAPQQDETQPPGNVAVPMDDMPAAVDNENNGDSGLTAAQAADAQQSMQKALQSPDDAATSAPAPMGEAIAPGPVGTVDAPGDDMPVVPKLSDLTLIFKGDSSDLSPDAQKKLDNLVVQLNDMTGGRIQVRGFATGENGGQASARRISLSRVLSVRSYLMDKGIKPTRVDVRAQGSETDRTPLDRVDLLFER
jgi:outer membrane protein OmpA-like peptidoglycan-associated protein